MSNEEKARIKRAIERARQAYALIQPLDWSHELEEAASHLLAAIEWMEDTP